MFKLEPDEKILIALHHHWIAILGEVLLLALFILLPLFILPFVASSVRTEIVAPLFLFALSGWYLVVLMMGFIFWVDYYLDSLVITTKRIININQIGLFRREIAEFRLERVQDVRIEIPNFMATFLRYGNLTIQTASEANFSIKEVPRVYEAKELILKHSQASGREIS